MNKTTSLKVLVSLENKNELKKFDTFLKEAFDFHIFQEITTDYALVVKSFFSGTGKSLASVFDKYLLLQSNELIGKRGRPLKVRYVDKEMFNTCMLKREFETGQTAVPVYLRCDKGGFN